MRVSSESLVSELRSVCIYGEDLERLISLIEKNAESEVNVSVGRTQFDSLEEFRETFRDKRISGNLYFAWDKPYASIELREHSTRIYFGKDDVKSKGFFHSVRDLLVEKQLSNNILLSYRFAFAVNLCSLAVLWLSDYFARAVFLYAGIMSIVCSLYLLVIGILSTGNRLKKKSVISFMPQPDNSELRKENLVKILYILFTAVIGGLIGFASSELSHYLHPCSTSSTSLPTVTK